MEQQRFSFDDGWETGPLPLWGQAIRYPASAELIRSGAPMSVSEPVDRLRYQGFLLPAKPSKVVSDALRWEVRKGRIIKVRRGVHRTGCIPRSTRYWVLDKAAAVRSKHLGSTPAKVAPRLDTVLDVDARRRLRRRHAGRRRAVG